MKACFPHRPAEAARDLLGWLACIAAEPASPNRIRMLDQLGSIPPWHALPVPEDTAPERSHRGSPE